MRRPDAIMLQCGVPTITFSDTTVIYTLPEGTIAEKLSAQIAEGDVPSDIFNKLAADPHDYITKAIGADKLDDKKRIRVARRITVELPTGDSYDRLDCIVFPLRGQKDNVRRRSGINVVCVNTIGRDPTDRIVALPRDTTLQKACFINKSLGERALGVVKVRQGYAIRCGLANRPGIEAHIAPEQAKLLGEQIKNLDTKTAHQYYVSGVPDTVDQKALY